MRRERRLSIDSSTVWKSGQRDASTVVHRLVRRVGDVSTVRDKYLKSLNRKVSTGIPVTAVVLANRTIPGYFRETVLRFPPAVCAERLTDLWFAALPWRSKPGI